VAAYLSYFAIIGLAITIARLPWKTVLKRSLIEIPFVLFALLMPFFGTGARVEFLGLSLYEEGVKHWKVIANSAGALFIRSYERGERVHLAMISRGYTGHMPREERTATSTKDLIQGFSLPALACIALIFSLLVRR
jgi:energy-coupling factor transporter transmembrane protein EcfT